MTLRRLSLAAGLGAALVAAGCHNDELMTPTPPAYTGGAMFDRYVSLGNSITSGFQSGERAARVVLPRPDVELNVTSALSSNDHVPERPLLSSSIVRAHAVHRS